jgi:prepilin-type N-terminal cleavage/methylation domain-containing protein
MKKKAFTLIELLIVIAIIGVLAAALYPTIRDALSRGRDAAREGDINNIVTAIETYSSDYGQYPPFSGCVGTGDVFKTPDGVSDVSTDYFKGGTAPKDPSPSRSIDAGDDPGDCVANGMYYYEYLGTASGVEYIIGTLMETDVKNNSALIPDGWDGSADYTTGDKLWYMRVL